MSYEYRLCGIDEAGRGSLAGPLVVSGVILKDSISKLKDSKKLSEKQKNNLFKIIKKNSFFHTICFSALDVDTFGLSVLIKRALKEIIMTLKAREYLFDGNNNFGINNLKTMIKADDAIDSVKAASIISKVIHDRYMYDFDKLFPQYRFKNNKGYGTKKHINAIKEYGYCSVHRRSYEIKALKID